MPIRFVKIAGNTPEARLAELARIEAWMGSHGWELMDYSEDLHSAVFDRSTEAEALSWFHPSHWMHGPRIMDWELLRRPLGIVLILGVMAFGGLAGWVLLNLELESPFSNGSSTERSTSPLPKELQEAREGEWWAVNTEYLNLRTQPSTRSPIVERLVQSQEVLVVKFQDGWAEIISPTRGFVASQYLSRSAAR